MKLTYFCPKWALLFIRQGKDISVDFVLTCCAQLTVKHCNIKFHIINKVENMRLIKLKLLLEPPILLTGS